MDEHVRRWIEKARHDLEAAEKLFAISPDLSDVVCFHAQQAVEKLLKAFLTHHGVRVPRTHDIGLLLDMCRQVDEDFTDLDADRLENLTLYAVSTRYPEDFYAPSEQDAIDAINAAKDLWRFILGKLGGDSP